MEDKPKYQINADIVAQADQCNTCHRCLKDPTFDLCRIDYVAASGEVLFVSADQCRDCGYQIPFGEGLVCGCPVRKAIQKKYSI